MSILNQTKNLNKKRFLQTVWSLVAISWAVMFTVLFVTHEKSIQLAAVTITAIATEGAIWCTAAITGVAVIESRKAIMNAIAEKLTGKKSI
ncbi:hypothetical protein [Pseudoalteromonas luteoviolacea]|uniref:Uncharacterized protein n=1 Tax=Pseudoalteromonas luteoviolacea NCIMB 1942 TaxID=1365253 RepID=A0A162A4T7_9GAMM|nr:hypothetical protein [Pseudoalteromonas luteoviolacea]KZN44203.1 hypothetical protein N482_17565 [Pseudoalteromonas luteoviolacea NCIMB 1942]KZX00981.1 hypothetical protein JL49_08340 [Pseudoalteromonas luteoviolacea]